METVITPQIFAIGGLSVLLLIALVLRYFSHRKPARNAGSRFGESHSQAIADMGDRTRTEAQRKERELMGVTSPRIER